MKILVIIPARGGSKGIPRKNLRILKGNPLIYYSIKTALGSKYKPDVYVSSEDDEILMMAERFGAHIHKRPGYLAGDGITLDSVVHEAIREIPDGDNYQYVITMQPTSPMLKISTLDNAIDKMIRNKKTDAMISARKEAHLVWRQEDGRFVPDYTERVNRQFLTPYFVETGGFVICKSSVLRRHKKRIAGNIDLYLLKDGEEIDVDTFEDWSVCEYLMKRKTVLFVVSGYREIGLGHIYRSLILANHILNHRIVFLVDRKSSVGYKKIRENNYEVFMQENADIVKDIERLLPDIIVNDILDTGTDYMKRIRSLCRKVINFEDLGEGAEKADLVINALYPEVKKSRNHYFGHKYFCARDEFFTAGIKEVRARVNNVLITFGGVDPDNLTLKVLEGVYAFCNSRNVEIDVVLGLGYEQVSTLKKFGKVKIHRNIRNMSQYMLKADIVITSAGRTVYEVACIGTPCIVIAQNERELSHLFASGENGFINMGLGRTLGKARIAESFKNLFEDYDGRCRMNTLMLSKRVREGRNRVINMIKHVIEAEK